MAMQSAAIAFGPTPDWKHGEVRSLHVHLAASSAEWTYGHAGFICGPDEWLDLGRCVSPVEGVIDGDGDGIVS